MGSVFLIITTIFKKNYNKLYTNCTESTIGEFDRLTKRKNLAGSKGAHNYYYPIYKYIVNGQQYYCNGHNGAYYEKDISTENKVIYYNPNNPSESYMDRKTTDMVMKIFTILGILFIIIDIILIIIKFIMFN